GTKTLNAPITVIDKVDVDAATLNANGNLILAAANNQTARIAQITNGGSITGNIEAHNYLVTNATPRWAIIGAGGVNGQSVGTWGSAPQQIPMQCSGCQYSVAVNSVPSVQGWD